MFDGLPSSITLRPYKIERYLANNGWRLFGNFENIENYWQKFVGDNDESIELVVPLEGSANTIQFRLRDDVRLIAQSEQRSINEIASEISEAGQYRLVITFGQSLLRPDRLKSAGQLALTMIGAINFFAKRAQSSTFRIQKPGDLAVIDPDRLHERKISILFDERESRHGLLRDCFEQLINGLIQQNTTVDFFSTSFRVLQDAKVFEAIDEMRDLFHTEIRLAAIVPDTLTDTVLGETSLDSLATVLDRPLEFAAATMLRQSYGQQSFGGRVRSLKRGANGKPNAATIEPDGYAEWRTARLDLSDEQYEIAISAHLKDQKIYGSGTLFYKSKRYYFNDIVEFGIL